MRHVRSEVRLQGRFAVKSMAFAVAAIFANSAGAQALPTGYSPVTSGTSMSQTGSTMTGSNGTQQRAVINRSTFDIGNGATVNFTQPSATAIAVNRVTSGPASAIDGALTANGHVMVLNPNGVIFGSTAVVNVGGL